MSSTEHKAFLQRCTSTAEQRKAYREQRKAERKAFVKLLKQELAELQAIVKQRS